MSDCIALFTSHICESTVVILGCCSQCAGGFLDETWRFSELCTCAVCLVQGVLSRVQGAQCMASSWWFGYPLPQLNGQLWLRELTLHCVSYTATAIYRLPLCTFFCTALPYAKGTGCPLVCTAPQYKACHTQTFNCSHVDTILSALQYNAPTGFGCTNQASTVCCVDCTASTF